MKKKKLYDKLQYLVVKFPFISINIPASPADGVYISQLERYSRACAQYSDFLDKTQLPTQKTIKQDYVAPK
jgi:alpha-amylase/alpha-mannosidase (GH57 family)